MFSRKILLLLVGIGGCAFAPLRSLEDQQQPCYFQGGELPKVVYIDTRDRIADLVAPAPRPNHLAPYPPSSEGEYRIRFRDADYLAAGMPVRVTLLPTSYRLIEIGRAGEIPIYVSTEYEGRNYFPRVWAPITETCVFLPFNHESEVTQLHLSAKKVVQA